MRRRAALAVIGCLLVSCSGSGESTPTTAAPVTSVGTTSTAPTTTTPSSPSTAPPTPTTVPPYVSEIYADSTHWLCRPDLADPCDGDFARTIVAADGTLTVEPYSPAADAPVDCFYVYPTSSEDPGITSDLVSGREIVVAQVQAARFSQACNLYAPMYRSVTLAGLGRLFAGGGGEVLPAWASAYADVADAWRHYLANDNQGRGVILIGHSQGAFHLTQLLRDVVDPDPAQRALLVGAYVIGGSVAVPEGADIGGDLQHIPLCRALDQTACVVTYATFAADAPPAADALFGRPRLGGSEAGLVAGCVNPAAPDGGRAVLSSALSAGSWVLADGSAEVTTPFVDLPGLVEAECAERNGVSYLEITFRPDPADPRADVVPVGNLGPQWGLHQVDVQIASGSLVDMMRAQIAAHTANS